MLLHFYLSLCLHNPFTVSELSWLKYVKEKFKFTNFTKCLANWLFEIVGWGKTGLAHSPPPPPLGSNLSIYLSVPGLNYSYTKSEHSWLTYLKEKFKLQSFSQMILLNRLWGKTGSVHSFPPLLFSNLSIYLSVFRFNLLLHCFWTLMIVLS